MNCTIHVIIENDNVFKNKLKLMMESFDYIFKFYNNEEVYISNYTYPLEEGAKECILLFLNNDGSHINRLNNINNNFGIVPIIILSDEPSISLCRESFKSGAFDFFPFPFKDIEISNSINCAAERFTHELEDYKKHIYLTNKFDRLSIREREIMDMILDGNTSKETAEKLSLSPRTVEVHRSNIYTKLGIKSLPQLIQEYDYINTYPKNM
ncbi:response regulator transcription factor [Providencia sp.]|uniref:response regulator transcription factor n=1 Tax=Providencia sp. TaxID=589 RepID=UPI000E9D35B3|nr:LuxR family transcriptional regulator [Providencia sp.]MBP6082056.1 helix-turn-helix transcriptional regulator [Providencia sp.]HBO22584.1 helix-turn-helix transcriptional regulator [Providencia sp.]